MDNQITKTRAIRNILKERLKSPEKRLQGDQHREPYGRPLLDLAFRHLHRSGRFQVVHLRGNLMNSEQN